MKYMALVVAAGFAVSTASAGVVFTDTFNYTVTDAMVAEGGWSSHTGTGGSDAGSGFLWGNGNVLEYNYANAVAAGDWLTADATVIRDGGGYGYGMLVALWDGADPGTRTNVASVVRDSSAGGITSNALHQLVYEVTSADITAGLTNVIFQYSHAYNWGETADVTFQVLGPGEQPGAEPPVWNVSPIEESGIAGRPFSGTLAGQATDPNLDPITYSKDTGPAWLVVATNGTLSGTPVSTGTNVFTVLADDGNTTPSTNTLNIAVEAGLPPVWTTNVIQGADGMAGIAYNGTLAGLATEPNGDPIVYSLVSAPTWLNVASNGILSGTPGAGDAGSNTFTVAATDIDGSTNATLNIYVEGSTPGIVLINGEMNHDLSTIEGWKDNAVGNWELKRAIDGASTNDYCALVGNGANGHTINYTVLADDVGQVITLKYDLWTGWAGLFDVDVTASLYVNGVLQIQETTAKADITTNVITVVSTNSYTLQAGDVGTVLNIQFDSANADAGWHQSYIDNVSISGAPVAASVEISGPVASGTGMVLSWLSQPDSNYTVQTNSNLIGGSWVDWLTGIPGGGSVSVTNTIGSDDAVFFRVITE